MEIAASSLSDNPGEKRMLYENLGVQKYWIVDVNQAEIIALAIANGGSKRIETSKVLLGLTMRLVETTLKRSRGEERGAITRWLLSKFSKD